MSAGYAERLKDYPNKGVCGLPENYDPEREFQSKLDRLAQLMRRSKYTVVLTGAGISTSAGIPDFRGPSGIWTKEQRERERKKRKHKKKKTETKKKNGDWPGEDAMEGDRENGAKDENIEHLPTPSPMKGRKRRQSEMQETPPEQNSSKKFTSFENAVPTYTHRALTHLILHPPPTTQSAKSKSDAEDQSHDESNDKNNKNNPRNRTYLHHIVTQNVDGLHRKTQLPRVNMSILHGDIFTEVCDACSAEHVRTREIQSIGLRHTGRPCTLGGDPPGSCPGRLRDTLLDWEDDLPEADWARAEEECARADLVLCLGTSLRIEPAAGLCEYPTSWPWPWDDGSPSEELEGGGSPDDEENKGKERKGNAGGKLGYAIVNLQETPYDDEAELVVRAKVDDVMRGLMEKFGYDRDWDAVVIE